MQDANFDELNAWAPKVLAKLQTLPELRDVGDRPAGRRHDADDLTIDRDMASRFGIQPQLIDDTLYDAFGQRQVTQYFTQVNTYEVIEEITPSLQGDPKTLDELYIRSPTNGQLVPLSAFAKWTTVPVAPLSISHQGAVPGGDDQLQSRAGRGARPGDGRHPARRAGTAAARRLARPRSRATRRRSRIR